MGKAGKGRERERKKREEGEKRQMERKDDKNPKNHRKPGFYQIFKFGLLYQHSYTVPDQTSHISRCRPYCSGSEKCLDYHARPCLRAEFHLHRFIMSLLKAKNT